MASDNRPEVSVVIPVWDRREALFGAIETALGQEEVNHEVIVVDDGSEPPVDLRAIVDTRLRLIRHERNRGPAAARNSGVAAARGRYLAFLDSDDSWHPRKLALQLAVAREAGELTAVGCGWRISRGGVWDVVIPPDAADAEAFASGAWHGAGTTMLLPQAALDHIGPQNEDMLRLEDYDWYLRFAAAGGRLTIVPQALATIAWRPHDEWPEIDRACARLADRHLGPGSPHSAAVQRRIRAYSLLIRSSRRWHGRRRASALWLLFRSWLTVPRTQVFLDRPERRRQ
ncbi:MAG: glycosyltransferase family 2 protein [Bauldia sp.]|nr:glycosyltransferase family 2 protein [Bauldia sp.]